MSSNVKKIGFVGWGLHAQKHARQFLLHDVVEIVAICGTRSANIEAAKQRRDALGLSHVPIYTSDLDFEIEDISVIKNMLQVCPDIDALVVSTPNTMHYPQVKYALENSLHVMVDKPLANNYNDAKTLVELAQKKQLKLIVANQRRYETAYRYIREQVRTGGLGRIISVNGILSHRRSWLHGWLANPMLSGGGAIYSIGHHLIDIIIWLVGERVTEVKAHASFREKQVEDFVDALIVFENGCSTLISINHGAPENSVCERLQIWAKNGTVVIDRLRPIYDSNPPTPLCQYSDGSIAQFDPTVSFPPPNNPVDDFIFSITSNTPSVSSGEQNLMTMRTIDAITKSFMSGMSVSLRFDQVA